MRDVDDGEAELALEVLDLEAHFLAQVRVQARERLVQQHHVRVDGERAGERDPLLAAAGEVLGALFCDRQQVRVSQGLAGAPVVLRLIADSRLTPSERVEVLRIAQGFACSEFEEPGEGMKRKYWKING